MAIKRSPGEKVFEVFNISFMIILMMVTIYPFVHVAFASVSEPGRFIGHTGLLLKPYGFTLRSYRAVFSSKLLLLSYRNTLFYVSLGTAVNIFVTTLGAYVLSRKGVYWKNFIMVVVVITMYFHGGLIPTYMVVNTLNLDNTWGAIVLPTAVSTWNLIVMRTSLAAIPESMEESAKIDGANHFTILFKVIVPLSMPIISVMLLFYGVSNWNRWFEAMIYLRDRTKYPLQLVLREVLVENQTQEMMMEVRTERAEVTQTVKHATIMVATLPIVFAYPFLQKYFIKGVMVGALKG